MNTQSHVLMGALLFGRKMPNLAWAGALGGLVPDLPMFAIIGYLRASGRQFEEIFGKLYWEHWWQVANAVGHNFILWSAVCVSGYLASRSKSASRQKQGALAFAFSGAALLHSSVDFLCHRNDGHMHFWPLTEWRFVSPISYWDSAHYGNQFALFETTLGVLSAILLFRTFRHSAVRTALAISAILYVVVPAFFILNMNH